MGISSGNSNRRCCFSFSAFLLDESNNFGGLIFGGGRNFVFSTCSAIWILRLLFSLRSLRRSLRSSNLPRKKAPIANVNAPVLSATLIQSISRASVPPRSAQKLSRSLAPRSENAAVNQFAMAIPIIPPLPCGSESLVGRAMVAKPAAAPKNASQPKTAMARSECVVWTVDDGLTRR